MDKVIIPDKEVLDEKIKRIKEEGVETLHVIADFDNTLTKAFVNGRKFQSAMAQIRTWGYLSDDYVNKSFALYDLYHPIEIDPEVDMTMKNMKMIEWWSAHRDLLVEYGMKKEIIEKILEDNRIILRENINDFIKLLKNKKIPLLIFSAGIGDLIEGILKKNEDYYNQISIISNFFRYDEEGNVLGYKGEIIHTFNKGEVAISEDPHFENVADRKNVILLGDSLGDLSMADGLEHGTKLTIGGFNEEDGELLDEYKNRYDFLVLNDGTMEPVVELFKTILN